MNDRRRAIMGVSVKKSRLPNAYQEVNYLIAKGEQYINTGVYPNSDYSITTKYSTEYDYANNQGYLCGAEAVYFRLETGKNKVMIYNKWGASGTGDALDFYPTTDGAHTVKIDKNGAEFDGVSRTATTVANYETSTYQLIIGALDNRGTPIRHFIVKIYYYTINNGNENVRKFIPCYRKVDGKAGFYDLINNEFYTNANTSASEDFGVGDDVDNNAPIQINDNSNFIAQYPSGVWNDTGYANAIITYDFNGKFTVNTSKELTETGTPRKTILATFNVIAGHKYLLRGNPTKPATATAGNYSNIQVDQNQGYTAGTYILTNTAAIGEFTTSGEARLLMFYYTNQTYDNAEYLPQMIDLTATFGAGNEPTTVEEFNEIYPDEYYPYNAG